MSDCIMWMKGRDITVGVLTITDREGETSQLEIQPGQSLMRLLRDNGFDELQAICGGSCSCATCHVYVSGDAAATLAPMSEDEDELLSSSGHRTEASRLSCQIQLTEALAGLDVRIAPED